MPQLGQPARNMQSFGSRSTADSEAKLLAEQSSPLAWQPADHGIRAHPVCISTHADARYTALQLRFGAACQGPAICQEA